MAAIHDLEFHHRDRRRDHRDRGRRLDVFTAPEIPTGGTTDRSSVPRPETLALDPGNYFRSRHRHMDVQRIDDAWPIPDRATPDATCTAAATTTGRGAG